MGQALSENQNEGQSRIEITYTATTTAGEDEILHPIFHERAKIDLDQAERALETVNGLCWHLSLRELLENFTTATRTHQLLIVQPTLMAMVYAANSKPGCFTGFTQIRLPNKTSNYFDFIAARALPGPKSVTTCILQLQGSAGETQYLVLEKWTALSEIPGLRYQA